jgi:hypothetical protein
MNDWFANATQAFVESQHPLQFPGVQLAVLLHEVASWIAPTLSRTERATARRLTTGRMSVMYRTNPRDGSSWAWIAPQFRPRPRSEA